MSPRGAQVFIHQVGCYASSFFFIEVIRNTCEKKLWKNKAENKHLSNKDDELWTETPGIPNLTAVKHVIAPKRSEWKA